MNYRFSSKEIRDTVRNMSDQAKITSKGQITLPIRVRDMLGVTTGDHLSFEKKGQDIVVRPVRGRSPFEKYRGIFASGKAQTKEEFLKEFRKFRGDEPE